MNAHRASKVAGVALLAASASLLPLTACSNYKSSGGESGVAQQQALIDEARQTVGLFRDKDPSLREFFDSAVGYAVFPTVAKGAAGIGAAHGNGVLFEGGSPVGFVDLTQGTIGVQLGGQTYRELIFFENDAVLQTFKNGNMEFQAQASAVAAESGAAANSDFENGVAVFTMARGGLMFEAAIGGQKFDYEPR